MKFKNLFYLFISTVSVSVFGMEIAQHTGTIEIYTKYSAIKATQDNQEFFKERNFSPIPTIGAELVRVRIKVEDENESSDIRKEMIMQTLECEKYKDFSYDEKQKKMDMTMITPLFSHELFQDKQVGDYINFEAYGHQFNLQYREQPVVMKPAKEDGDLAEVPKEKKDESHMKIIRIIGKYAFLTLISVPIFHYIIKPTGRFSYSWLKSCFSDELRWLSACLSPYK